jgi:hypothetical protein
VLLFERNHWLQMPLAAKRLIDESICATLPTLLARDIYRQPDRADLMKLPIGEIFLHGC